VGITLEVAVTHERDVPGAVQGGADRLLVSGTAARSTAQVSGICREAGAAEVFVELYDDSPATEDLQACGARGFAFGVLDADLEVHVAATRALAREVGTPWLFTLVDDTLDPRRSWRRLVGLEGLVGVLSAGSPRGLGEGYDELLATAEADREVAGLLVPGEGLLAEHVPWFVRAGVRTFHLGTQVRPGASWRSYVDAGLTRSWRTLLDAAVDRV
jgi:copper homeostasis protein